MKFDTPAPRRRLRLFLVVSLVIAIAIAGGWGIKDFLAPPAPNVGEDWRTLLAQLRDLERRIGFRPSSNFARLATDLAAYPFCGRASNRRLPYSYQDKIIEWPEIEIEAECHKVGADTDVYFDKVEAWGEIGTPVTVAMATGKLDRFVYLVIHEDCHDQFALPYGIEEPLCDVITHRAMSKFAAERYRWYDVEARAIKRYARNEPEQARTTIAHYRDLERLYAQFERGELEHARLLELRAQIFERAAKSLEVPGGELNNIIFANYMTYSRHYPVLAQIADAWDDDLAGLVEFFRRVDARKPAPEAILKRLGIDEQKDPVFLRAYEERVLETALTLSAGVHRSAR